MKRIIVGTDGSAGAVTALEWAVAEARAHDAQLSVIGAFAFTEVVGVPGAMWPVESYETLEARTQEMLAKAIADAGAAGDPKVEMRALFGSASEVLLDAARDADLLVVGSRGRGGFAGLLLGSVSQKCITHAVCPTVVIPTPEDET